MKQFLYITLATICEGISTLIIGIIQLIRNIKE